LLFARQDVLKQWDRISAVWGTFRQQVLVIPGALSDRVTVLGCSEHFDGLMGDGFD